jgi:predicted dehydrogenase
VRFYAGPDEKMARMWPWTDVSLDPSRDARRHALETGPYGRCVYRCDNDVPDHQVLALEFENGVTATFTLHGLASEERRTIRITGTAGELRGVFQDGVIEVSRHGSLALERHEAKGSAIGHYGGDEGLLAHFTDVLARGAGDEVRASGRVSLESHLIGFAAAAARLEGRVVEMAAFRDAARRSAAAR